MDARQTLVRLLERQQDSFIEMVKRVPADRLDWSPAPGMRSALDQFQEVATAVGQNWDVYSERKMEWSPERMEAWKAHRAEYTTLEALEARLREDTARIVAHVRSLTEEDLATPTEMPFPGEFLVVDNVYFHVWNMAYHEGQISYLLQMLGVDPMG